MKTTIKTAGPEEFFRRGRDIAKLADQGQAIPKESIIAIEECKEQPTSCTGSAQIPDSPQPIGGQRAT